jgi:uncharacterized protein with ParB-like and HNH nuclease domain
MALESKENSVEKLYKENCYTIPNYQRGYAWGKDDAKQLINDLQDSIELKKDFYFLSSITVCLESDSNEQKNKKQNKCEFVIDGQQRLITISLIIKSLLDKVKPNSKTQSDLIDCIKLTDEKPRLNLDNDDDRESFEKIIFDKDINTNNALKINEVFSYVKEEIKSLHNPTKFAEFLLKNTYVVKNTTYNEEYACQIFESLNDRGVPLNAFDLIKNRLFLLSNSDKTHNIIQKIQGSIKASLGNGRTLSPNTRDYFRVYLQTSNNERFIDNGSMYKEFKNQIKSEQCANNFINNLNEDNNIRAFLSIKNKSLSYQSVNTIIDKLPNKDYLKHYFNQTRNLIICQPVLFSLFVHMNKEYITNTLKDLYCLIARTNLLGLRLSKIQDMLANIASEIHNNKNISFSQKLEEYLNSNEKYTNITSIDYIDNFSVTLNSYANIKEQLSKDILFDICLFSKKSSMQTFQKPYGDVSIEHILPQKPINYPKISPDEHKLYLNNIGNHSILETKDNTRNSNDGIKVKLEKTFNSEKYQDFPVVSNIDNYLDNGEWTIKSINNRKKDLISTYVNLVKFSWE